jgi:hypothetical protein
MNRDNLPLYLLQASEKLAEDRYEPLGWLDVGQVPAARDEFEGAVCRRAQGASLGLVLEVLLQEA